VISSILINLFHRRSARQVSGAQQPAAIAGMEGLFHSEAGAGLVLIGASPNEATGQIDQSHRGQ